MRGGWGTNTGGDQEQSRSHLDQNEDFCNHQRAAETARKCLTAEPGHQTPETERGHVEHDRGGEPVVEEKYDIQGAKAFLASLAGRWSGDSRFRKV
jgi:hypothetical protein